MEPADRPEYFVFVLDFDLRKWQLHGVSVYGCEHYYVYDALLECDLRSMLQAQRSCGRGPDDDRVFPVPDCFEFDLTPFDVPVECYLLCGRQCLCKSDMQRS